MLIGCGGTWTVMVSVQIRSLLFSCIVPDNKEENTTYAQQRWLRQDWGKAGLTIILCLSHTTQSFHRGTFGRMKVDDKDEGKRKRVTANSPVNPKRCVHPWRGKLTSSFREFYFHSFLQHSQGFTKFTTQSFNSKTRSSLLRRCVTVFYTWTHHSYHLHLDSSWYRTDTGQFTS